MTKDRRVHFIIGSGSHGCMYDNGPHAHNSLDSAVSDLTETFNLGRDRQRALKRNRSLELNSRRDGAEYCEITECSCNTPWEHNEDSRPEDWPDYQDDACTCPLVWNGHDEPTPDPTRKDPDCPIHGGPEDKE